MLFLHFVSNYKLNVRKLHIETIAIKFAINIFIAN